MQSRFPVVPKHFIPAPIANRIQRAIAAEMLRLLDELVAAPRDINDAIIHGRSLCNPILGHLAKADFIGLRLKPRAFANAGYTPPPHGRTPKRSTPFAPEAGPR